MTTTPKRSGLSLLEVIVVLGILAVLVGLLVPAIMEARASARRVQCKDHLRQLALATVQYESIHKRYMGCQRELLPLLGENALYEKLRYRRAHMGRSYPTVRTPAILACPDDTKLPGGGLRTSYLANNGTRFYESRRSMTEGTEEYNGIHFDWLPKYFPAVGEKRNAPSYIRASMVTDGLSSTAMYSEALNGMDRAWFFPDRPERSSVPHPRRRMPWKLTGRARTPDELLRLVQDPSVTPQPPKGFDCYIGRDLTNNLFGGPFSLYDHILPPNSLRVWVQHTLSDGSYWLASARPPSSLHRGGVNLAFCDGHVRFISNQIDITVWRAIGTRNGKEVANF